MINPTLIKVKSIADFITFAKANAGFVILGKDHTFVAAWSAVTLHPAFEIILHGNTSVVATTFENKWFDGRQHGFEAVNVSASRLKDLIGCLFAFGEGHTHGYRPAEPQDFQGIPITCVWPKMDDHKYKNHVEEHSAVDGELQVVVTFSNGKGSTMSHFVTYRQLHEWLDVANLAWFKPTPLQNLTQILKGNTLRDDVDVRYYEGVEKILTTGEV